MGAGRPATPPELAGQLPDDKMLSGPPQSGPAAHGVEANTARSKGTPIGYVEGTAPRCEGD